MNFFEEFSYKSILRKTLLNKKERLGSQYSFQNMARHCRIQKTYLSRVLNDDKTHLSSDQLYLALDFLALEGEESRFTFLLFEKERSSLPERQSVIDRELKSIQKRHRKTEGSISERVDVVQGNEVDEYYIDPYIQVIHVFMTIEKYRANPDLIRVRLGLTKERFAFILEQLVNLRLLEFRGGQYKPTKIAIHLSSDSALVHPYRVMMRLKALEQIHRLPADRTYSFSVVFSATPAVRKSIQDAFFKFLKVTEEQVKGADPEEVYQMNFDLLPWGN